MGISASAALLPPPRRSDPPRAAEDLPGLDARVRRVLLLQATPAWLEGSHPFPRVFSARPVNAPGSITGATNCPNGDPERCLEKGDLMSTSFGKPTPEAGSVSVAPKPLASTFSSLMPHDRIELREGYAKVGDQSLHYVEAGDGP